jgi:N-carbamoylputrescine amidase
MKITVCELNDEPAALARDWQGLVAHVRAEQSQLVLLPEMPFHPWFARTLPFEPAVWQAALAAHDRWLARLPELALAAAVLGTRPTDLAGGQRANQAFVWQPGSGCRAAHLKHYLPNEDGFWEASWYGRGDGRFEPVDCAGVRVGFLICTELWFMERARAYGRAGIHLLANPRGAELRTVERWLVGGRAAAIISGAFCLSSNRAGPNLPGAPFGGHGWIINPSGDLLAVTSPEQPFITLDLDLGEAERAKCTYPRDVIDDPV